MKVVPFESVAPSAPVRSGFRGGQIRFRDLLQGNEGAPDNFALQWVEVDTEYHSPQHRHNFEQIRIMIEGSFGFGAGLVQEEGSAGYFCEGTYYTQSATERSVTLLLQVGGPSAAGFMSRRQLRAGIESLSGQGEFRDGVYTWHDSAGKKHNQDSYEAAWEYVNGRAIEYPKPQYSAPILMRPERFAWLDRGDGVWSRPMGTFHERGLSIAQLKLAAGADFQFDSSERSHLLFCASGSGKVGDASFSRWSSIQVDEGEPVALRASTESMFWVLGLPRF